MLGPRAGKQASAPKQPSQEGVERRASFRRGKGRRGSQPLWTAALKVGPAVGQNSSLHVVFQQCRLACLGPPGSHMGTSLGENSSG